MGGKDGGVWGEQRVAASHIEEERNQRRLSKCRNERIASARANGCEVGSPPLFAHRGAAESKRRRLSLFGLNGSACPGKREKREASQ